MPTNTSIFEATGQTFTAIPNYFLDHIAPNLSASELRVMLYIYRHTLGYHKLSDALSYDQFLNGITSRDGHCLDQGAKVSRGSLVGALASLEVKGLILRLHPRGSAKTSTTFQVTFKAFPSTVASVTVQTKPVPELDINEKVAAEPEKKHKGSSKKIPTLEKGQNLDLGSSSFTPQEVQKIDPTKETFQKNSEINRATEAVKLILEKVPGISQSEAKRLVDLALSDAHGRDTGYISRIVNYVSSNQAIRTPAAVFTALIKTNQDRTPVEDIDSLTNTTGSGFTLHKSSTYNKFEPGKNSGKGQRGPIDFSKYSPGGKYGHLISTGAD